MITQTKCLYCGHEFEVDVEAEGHTAICPNCGKETKIKSQTPPVTPAPSATASKLTPCKVCGHQISKNAWICLECGDLPRGLYSPVLVVTFYVFSAAALFSLIGLAIAKIIEGF